MGEDGKGEDRKRPPAARGVTSPWEWAVGVLGALLVGGTIAFMLWETVALDQTPPDIVIQVDSVTQTRAGWLVEFRARNLGTTTAAQVNVEGELRADTGVVETSDATIDFVPGRSFRRAGLLFSEDPRRHRMEIRTKGYDLP